MLPASVRVNIFYRIALPVLLDRKKLGIIRKNLQ
jgi:hypothetical protein